MDFAGNRPSDLVRIIQNNWFYRGPRGNAFRSALARGIKNTSKRFVILSSCTPGHQSDPAKPLYKTW